MALFLYQLNKFELEENQMAFRKLQFKNVGAMSNITIISSELSSSSGSPTVLSTDYQVYLLSHTDATVRYASVPNGSTIGEIKVVAMSTTGLSARIISATGMDDFVLNSANGIAITLLWSGTAWVLIGTGII